jgi:hypothetical protein
LGLRLLVAAALLLVLVAAPAAHAAQPRVTLSRTSAKAGEPVVLAGHGFRPRARVRVVLGGRTLRRLRAGRRGGFRIRFQVPARAAGSYRLVVLSGGVALRRRFRVLAREVLAVPGPPSPPPPPPPPPPAPPPPPTLVAAGDIACRPALVETATSCRHARTALLVEALAPDAVAALGDLQYQNGELENFQTAYGPTWGRFKAITHPVPGNHEYEGDPERDSAPGYYTYFGPAAGVAEQGYYRWSLGAWTIFALNSGALGYTRTRADLPDDCWPVSCAAGSAQEAWLRAGLAALPAGSCVLAYWHHPRYSSGFDGAYRPHPETEPLVAALTEYDAELILTGHSHNYERFDLGAGLTQFVVGTGGRDLYVDTGQPPLTTTLRTDVFGVLELTLAPGAWTSRFVAESGESIDGASGAC